MGGDGFLRDLGWVGLDEREREGEREGCECEREGCESEMVGRGFLCLGLRGLVF